MNVGMNLAGAAWGPCGGHDVMTVPASKNLTRCPVRRTDEHATAPAGIEARRGRFER